MCVCVMCNVCVYVGACVMCVCVWRGGISRGKSSEGGSGTERGKGKVEIGGRGHTCTAAVSLCVKLCSQVKQTVKTAYVPSVSSDRSNSSPTRDVIAFSRPVHTRPCTWSGTST